MIALSSKSRAFRFEQRNEDALRRGCRELREDLRHVGVALLATAGERDLAAKSAERFAKRGGEAGRVYESPSSMDTMRRSPR